MIREFTETTILARSAFAESALRPEGGGQPRSAPSRAAPSMPAETLAQRLDWLVDALPVERMLLDRTLVRAVRRLDSDGHLVLRRIRVAESAVFDLIALPRAVEDHPARLDTLLSLRTRRHRLGHPLRLIREAVVDREPRLSNARLIHECAGFHPSLCATRELIRHLSAAGGSASLRDCLTPLRGEVDPACAILALAGSKILRVDLEQPFGPESRVRLMHRRVPFA